jgi:hypothetical protein
VSQLCALCAGISTAGVSIYKGCIEDIARISLRLCDVRFRFGFGIQYHSSYVQLVCRVYAHILLTLLGLELL